MVDTAIIFSNGASRGVLSRRTYKLQEELLSDWCFHRASLDQTGSCYSKGPYLGFLLSRYQSLCAGVGGPCSLLTEDR